MNVFIHSHTLHRLPNIDCQKHIHNFIHIRNTMKFNQTLKFLTLETKQHANQYKILKYVREFFYHITSTFDMNSTKLFDSFTNKTIATCSLS